MTQQLDGDPAAMAQAAAIFDEKIRTFEAIYKGVAQQAEALPMRGPNAQHFVGLVEIWESRFKKVLDDLMNMSDTLHGSAHYYDRMEEDNKQILSQLQSILSGAGA